ncbi:MAG: HPF/RaiA family ribosome-associated protein [Phycisphaerae bacterium]|nr:HPF/RaiA family ribosome-associated protein [Phycisphaerae bacterium]NUQ44694.1 HPF/RaiA family ribosome-associated protein [Phycisphaerae bacterium]
MQVQFNTDNNIRGGEELKRYVESEVAATLDRFAQQITRVEVHLSDENSHKPGENDKRCLMEARLKGLQPHTVTHYAATLEQAIDGAAEKLERVLDRAIGKLIDSKGRTSASGDPGM